MAERCDPGGTWSGPAKADDFGAADGGPVVVVNMAAGLDVGLDRLDELTDGGLARLSLLPGRAHSGRALVCEQHVDVAGGAPLLRPSERRLRFGANRCVLSDWYVSEWRLRSGEANRRLRGTPRPHRRWW